MFGPEVGSKAYSYFFTAYSGSAILLAITVLFFQSFLGFQYMFYITCGMTVVAFVFLMFLKEKDFKYDDDKIAEEISMFLNGTAKERDLLTSYSRNY